MVTEWLAAIAGVGATIVALVSVVLARRMNRDALAAQANAMQKSHEHEMALIRDDRLWTRRADLYARIAEAVRAYVEGPAPKLAAPEDPNLARLVAEAEVFASAEVKDLIARFVYDDPSEESQIDIWGDILTQSRAELIGRTPPIGHS